MFLQPKNTFIFIFLQIKIIFYSNDMLCVYEVFENTCFQMIFT